MQVDTDFKLRLLLAGLKVTCCYFTEDEAICGITDKYDVRDKEGEFIWHLACNCYGDINKCDLPEIFQRCLIQE